MKRLLNMAHVFGVTTFALFFFMAPAVFGQEAEASKAELLNSPPPPPSVINFAGRIVYTAGAIHIYDGYTGVDVNTGVRGVNPKFSPNGLLVVYGGVEVMNSFPPYNPRRLTTVGATPSFDPTGSRIAYGNGGIWKINIDGTGLTQLTSDGGHQPAWSPDGLQIAYNAPVGGSQQLFIVNADGTNRHQALTTSGGIVDTVWLRSSKILFGLLVASKNYELYSFDPTIPASLTRLTTNRINDFEPSWSPDGTKISWVSGTSGSTGGIWIMNADGTGKQGPVIAGGRQGSWGY